MQNTLFLIARHGQTELNEKHLHVSHSDAHLDEKGEKQAREAGEFLSQLPFEIKTVISSPRTRTQETAAIICEALKLPEYYTDDRLTDLDVGDLTGKNEIDFPLDDYVKNPDKKFPNGESLDEFRNRQFEFAKALLNAMEEGRLSAGTVLIVTHEPVIDYWHNLQHDKKSDVIEKIVRPGGIVSVTDSDVVPILGKEKTAEEKQDDKIDPARLLYMPPEALGKGGAACGTCLLGIIDGDNAGKCVSVYKDSEKKDTTVNLKTGVCGLYVKGTADPLVQIQPAISRTEAGYIDKGGPTSCGLKNACEYFTGGKEFGCRKIDGRKTAKGYVEAGGCCNGWEAKK